MAAPEKVAIEHLPEGVNTYDSEFGGRFGPDSATLVQLACAARSTTTARCRTLGAYRVSIFREPDERSVIRATHGSAAR